MKIQHHTLAAGRWGQMSLVEQMANIGSEVERSLSWRAKQHADYSQQAFVRALELLDLTLADTRHAARLRELTLVREALVDFFMGPNQCASTDISWKNYFLCFGIAARRNR